MNKVCKLISEVNEGNYICGTGFFVSSNGYIVTSAHNVSNCKKTNVFYKNMCIDSKVLCEDRRLDIALLKIDDIETDGCMLAEPTGYCKCYTYGYPKDLFCINYQEGVVNSINYAVGSTIDAMISSFVSRKGTSGSPIFSQDGSVIGIVNWYSEAVGSGGTIFSLVIPRIYAMVKTHETPERGYLSLQTDILSIQDIIHNHFMKGKKIIKGVLVTGSKVPQIKKSDIIFGVNNHAVGGAYQSVESRLYTSQVGSMVELSVLTRESNYMKPKKINVVVERYPSHLDKPIHDQYFSNIL